MNNHNFEKLEIPLISKMFEIYEIAHKTIFSLPKFERYTLGEKIENTILDIIELTIIANHANKLDKERYLLRVNAKIELLKIFYRISLNCKLFDAHKYLAIQGKIQEAGKMTQGWIKYCKTF